MTKDTRSARRSAGWHILSALVAGSVGLGGCAADVGGVASADDESARTAIERIDAQTFADLDEDVDVWLDLRDPTRGYVVDTDAVPLERLSLVCPDGTVMPWTDWVAADPRLDGRVQGVVGLAADASVAAVAAEQADNPCPSDCTLCEDGATVCHPDWSCLEQHDIAYRGGSTTIDREVTRELWGTGWLAPPEPAPSPDGDGAEGGGGESDPTDPRSGGGSGSYGGSSGSGSSGSSSGGGGGGGSPGGHPGW